jgi:hypothetical protein
MSYHDYGRYTSKWSPPNEDTEKKPNQPRIQVISPQKKLYDIQQVINSLPEQFLSTVELAGKIQRILDGGTA